MAAQCSPKALVRVRILAGLLQSEIYFNPGTLQVNGVPFGWLNLQNISLGSWRQSKTAWCQQAGSIGCGRHRRWWNRGAIGNVIKFDIGCSHWFGKVHNHLKLHAGISAVIGSINHGLVIIGIYPISIPACSSWPQWYINRAFFRRCWCHLRGIF